MNKNSFDKSGQGHLSFESFWFEDQSPEPFETDRLEEFWRPLGSAGEKIKSSADTDADFRFCLFQISLQPELFGRNAVSNELDVSIIFRHCF